MGNTSKTARKNNPDLDGRPFKNKKQLKSLEAKKNGFMKSLQKDQTMILKSVNKENADKFMELKKLEKTENQSKVW
jgi:hypothetical protein